LTQSSTKFHKINSNNTLKDTYNERFNSALETHTPSLDHFSKPLPLLHPQHNQWGPLHTRDWEPVTITPQALSLVEKAELVQVRSTLRVRDQQSMSMQDGCKVYMDSYMASTGSCFMVTWTIFKNHLLEGGLIQNRDTIYGFPNAHNRWLILFYHVWGSTCMNRNHWNSIWLRARSHMTSQYTWRSMTTLHDFGGVLGWPLDTFLLGSHNFMVMALGSCVKWPWDHLFTWAIAILIHFYTHTILLCKFCVHIRATSHMGQESWSWNCENP
jgi:hypothetical protein